MDTLSALRILVVEDLRDAANSQAMLLTFWGHEATVAYSGEEALHAVSATPADVVFLDIDLPGIDGYEVARQLRRLPRMAEALLIAITGYGRESDVQRCKEAGIDYHFLKPADPAELQQLLAKAGLLRQEQRQEVC